MEKGGGEMMVSQNAAIQNCKQCRGRRVQFLAVRTGVDGPGRCHEQQERNLAQHGWYLLGGLLPTTSARKGEEDCEEEMMQQPAVNGIISRATLPAVNAVERMTSRRGLKRRETDETLLGVWETRSVRHDAT